MATEKTFYLQKPNGEYLEVQAISFSAALRKAVKQGVSEEYATANLKSGKAPTTPTPTTPTTPTTPPTTPTTTIPKADEPWLPTYPTGDYTAPPAEAFEKSRKKAQEIMEGRTTPTEPTTPTTEYTQDQTDDYNLYLEFLKTAEGKGWPTPQDIGEFLANFEQWSIDIPRGYTEEQLREYNTFMAYRSAVGTPDDWRPTSPKDFVDNYDSAMQQLDVWKQEYGTKLEEATVGEEYALDPAEAARRREEAYEETRYAAEERYRETPRYSPTSAAWLKEQSQFSGALEEFTEREFPSLRARHEETLSPLTGFPTREGARAEAAKREQSWKAWLTEETPGIEQKYWAQRPEQRGERLWMQAPGTRAVNW